MHCLLLLYLKLGAGLYCCVKIIGYCLCTYEFENKECDINCVDSPCVHVFIYLILEWFLQFTLIRMRLT
jgi:hypothetical protein